jgi:hypothetical protein
MSLLQFKSAREIHGRYNGWICGFEKTWRKDNGAAGKCLSLRSKS